MGCQKGRNGAIWKHRSRVSTPAEESLTGERQFVLSSPAAGFPAAERRSLSRTYEAPIYALWKSRAGGQDCWSKVPEVYPSFRWEMKFSFTIFLVWSALSPSVNNNVNASGEEGELYEELKIGLGFQCRFMNANNVLYIILKRYLFHLAPYLKQSTLFSSNFIQIESEPTENGFYQK